ncbi:MAG: SMC-Scp complex subunit ScpB [Planctomycetes bacterium]|nr:SMC-Scp complex subunit ScpB [Planctomycetota bacterium]
MLFALLFSSPEAVTLDRIREVLYPTPQATEGEVDANSEHFSPQQHLTELEHWMSERNLPLNLHKVGRAWRLLTSEEVAEDLISVRRQVHQDRMGPAALEVLSLVAYRQPVLKADIDAVRGVKSGPHLRHLLDMRLIRILGRSELPGRPFLYGTTREFLDRFGLAELKDLPEAGRLASPAEAPPAEPISALEAATEELAGAEQGESVGQSHAERAVEVAETVSESAEVAEKSASAGSES